MQLLLTIVALAYAVMSTLAQSVMIGAPAEWTSVKPGENITVRVDRPVRGALLVTIDQSTHLRMHSQGFQSSAEEVAVAIGFWPCGGTPCSNIDYLDEILGTVVYNGPYDPEYHPDTWLQYQNFTVTVPPSFQPGQQLSVNVAHFTLIGVCV